MEQCNSMMMFHIQCRHILLYTCHYLVVSLLVSIIAHLKVKDYGMGIYSFSSNNYKGCCLRIHINWVQEQPFNTAGEEIRIQHKRKVRLVPVVLSDITIIHSKRNLTV